MLSLYRPGLISTILNLPFSSLKLPPTAIESLSLISATEANSKGCFEEESRNIPKIFPIGILRILESLDPGFTPPSFGVGDCEYDFIESTINNNSRTIL